MSAEVLSLKIKNYKCLCREHSMPINRKCRKTKWQSINFSWQHNGAQKAINENNEAVNVFPALDKLVDGTQKKRLTWTNNRETAVFGLQVRVCVDLVHVNCENMETGCVEKQLLEESQTLNSLNASCGQINLMCTRLVIRKAQKSLLHHLLLKFHCLSLL